MISATLDTSCAQHFLSVEEEPDEALVEVIAAALRNRLSIAVSDEAFEEVQRTSDSELRQRRLVRLGAFQRVTLPADRRVERDNLATQLHAAVFPRARSGSRQDEHNWRDCRQMATHRLIGRDIFVTRDGTLLKRAECAGTLGVRVLSPTALRDLLTAEARSRTIAGPTPVSVRDASLPADEAEIRSVLGPLAADYPDFDAWLTRRLHEHADTRIRLGELEGRVRAVALSQRKDPRVWKLSAFFVAPEARDAGLGGHLLWSEIRTWVRQGLEKVYVTVSSRHAELAAFFTSMGFVVEGTSPRRYQSDTTEIILAKHLVRERFEEPDLDSFVDALAGIVFAVPAGVAISAQHWSLYPAKMRPRFQWEGQAPTLELVARDGEHEIRRWSVLDLERIFHPARFAIPARKALLIPIEQRWADALLEYPQQQQQLSSETSSKLLLRADNAYYCYPKATLVAKAGAPILFYVKEPVGAIIGEARVYDSVIDEPGELLMRFGDIGIYGLSNIREHTMRVGTNAGKALALRFGQYVPFEAPVDRKTIWRVLGRKVLPQGLTPVAFEEFEALRRTGGIEW